MCKRKTSILIGFILFLFVLSAAPSRAGSGIITIDENAGKVPVNSMIEYYEDADARLGIADVTGRAYADKWEKPDKRTPNFGFTKSTYWVRFTLKNTSRNALDLYLEQVYPLISSLTLFLPDGDGYAKTEIGHARPFKDRPVEHRSLMFPLKLEAGASITCYLAYRTKSAMNIDLVVWSREAFHKHMLSEAPVIWMFYGILFVMFVYHFIVFLSMRDLSYFYCALYIASFCLFMMSLSGFAYQYLWPDCPWWSNLAVPFLIGIIIVSIIQFARYLGEVSTYNQIIDAVLKVLIALSLVVSVFTLIINNYRVSIITATALAGVASTFGAWVLVLFVVNYKHRAARNYLISFVLFLAGVILYVLKTFGVLPDVFVTSHGIEIGAVFNVVALSLGLTDRINVMKNDLQEMNINLEDKVRARTEELEKAMGELEVVNKTIVNFNKTLEEAQYRVTLDMKMAANVQAEMLPRQAPKSDIMDIAFSFRPVSGVSGDFYDFYEINGDLAGVGIFDVSGHGVASGLLTLMARSVFSRNMCAGTDQPLNTVLERSNRELISEIGNIENYLTGILLRFKNDTVEYVNAGHSDILHRKSETGRVETINSTDGDFRGFLIGITGTDVSYETLSFHMDKNDVLLLYTDCVYEGRNRHGEEYGVDRLKNSLKNAPDSSAQEILDSLLYDFYKFIGPAGLYDDMTVIVIKKKA